MEVRNIYLKNTASALAEIAGVGANQVGCVLMAPKGVHRVLKVTGLTTVQANILKQEMLAVGAEAALARGVVNCSVRETDVLLMGTLKHYNMLLAKLKMQAFGLPALAGSIKEVIQNLEERAPYTLDARDKKLVLGARTLVMGILNVTPDSFSDGGKFLDPGKALERALQMVEEGADIIDVGGESTRPGYTAVQSEEEVKRVVPIIEKIADKVRAIISVDSCKAEVARQALEAGAHIVNDQWALQADSQMPNIVARYNAAVVIMHNQQGTVYKDMMGEIVRYFRESMVIAEQAGIDRNKIIIDPGIGFGKTVEQNLETINRLPELVCLGQPVLVGTSRKSVIGKTLDLPVDQRREGTAATVVMSIAGGADIIRVHDVKEMARVARMTDAIVRRRSGRN